MWNTATFELSQLHPFYCLCVLRKSIVIWLISVNTEPRHSSHPALVSSLILLLLFAGTLYWRVCALVPSFSLALENGCVWNPFVSSFHPPLMLLSLETNKKKKEYTRHAIHFGPSSKCGSLLLMLYWFVKNLKRDLISYILFGFVFYLHSKSKRY